MWFKGEDLPEPRYSAIKADVITTTPSVSCVQNAVLLRHPFINELY